jgi:endonuclease-3
VQHPQPRYELDWKTPEQLLVAAVLADGSRDAAVTDVTKVLFARWPDTSALAKADIAQLTQVSCRRRGSLESQARSRDLR